MSLTNENMNKLADTHLVLRLTVAPFGSSSLVIAGALYETMANENRLILAKHITSKMEINLQEKNYHSRQAGPKYTGLLNVKNQYIQQPLLEDAKKTTQNCAMPFSNFMEWIC